MRVTPDMPVAACVPPAVDRARVAVRELPVPTGLSLKGKGRGAVAAGRKT